MQDGQLSKSLVDAPEKCHLSLLIDRRTVYVFVSPIAPDDTTRPIVAALQADITAPTVAKAFQEVVYANPMLLLPFGRVTVMINARRYFWLPAETAACADEAARALGFDLGKDTECLTAESDGLNTLVMLPEAALVNFIRRTFPDAKLTHPAARLVAYLYRTEAPQPRRVFADLGHESLTVAVFDAAGLALCGSYHPTGVESQTYYIVAATRTAGLDPADTPVTVSGAPDSRAALIAGLRRFVKNVMPASLPADVADSNFIPYPLLISQICE
ncbi:MAG: DUF3822 family protein [Muribaculaceae bacterium]|nr:DUF3822 family protein [Muribaculaceae bacterium]